MINKLVVICIFAVSIIFQITLAQASPVDDVEILLEANRNIEGEFHQTTYDEKGSQLQVSDGIFLLAKPSQFVWDSVTPFAQRIVSDGEVITVWDIDLEQATQKPLSGTVGNSPAALLGQPAEKVLPHYAITALNKEKFSLEPKGDQDLFQTLTLEFKDKKIHSMNILDALGQTTIIEFKNIETHQGVAKDNFVLELPDYVDVIVEGQ